MQPTSSRYYSQLAERFCLLNVEYQQAFEEEFALQYAQAHVIDTKKLRNISLLFAHILQKDALPWEVLKCITLTQQATTSGSRCFIKFLFQELAQQMGLASVCIFNLPSFTPL